MQKKYYLGIDSGGTKTKFTLADESGYIICHVMAETTNYLQIGYQEVANNLKQGVEDVLEVAKIKKSDINKTFIGLASYGEIKSDLKNIINCLNEGLEGIDYLVGNDNLCGWGGSLGGKPGINVVSGTGSIVYGRNEAGEEIRCGGWGHYFGCDEGSAYWIASRLVNEFTRQSDNRSQKTQLYDYFMTNFKLEDEFDLLDLMVNKWNMNRTKIAQFCKVAKDLADMGDEKALAIFEEAGKELALMVNTCIKEIKFDNKVLVSYSGGVFKSGEIILEPFRKYLNPSAELITPMFDPAIGGVIIAMLSDHRDVNDEILKNLHDTQ